MAEAAAATAGQVGDGQEEMEDMEVMLHARHLKDERLLSSAAPATYCRPFW
jgi:hypothetical protein